MARVPRLKPARLKEKLLAIRHSLELSQSEMLDSLDMADRDRSLISGYELGTKEPPLPVLLKYARLVNISTDLLIDDKLDLPWN